MLARGAHRDDVEQGDQRHDRREDQPQRRHLILRRGGRAGQVARGERREGIGARADDAEGEALVKGSALAKIAAQPITVTLNYNPEYTVGEAEAYLCVILPNKEHESKFYKISAKCTE